MPWTLNGCHRVHHEVLGIHCKNSEAVLCVPVQYHGVALLATKHAGRHGLKLRDWCSVLWPATASIAFNGTGNPGQCDCLNGET